MVGARVRGSRRRWGRGGGRGRRVTAARAAARMLCQLGVACATRSAGRAVQAGEDDGEDEDEDDQGEGGEGVEESADGVCWRGRGGSSGGNDGGGEEEGGEDVENKEEYGDIAGDAVAGVA